MCTILTDDCSDLDDNSDDHLSECTSGAELHRKVVARAFWNSELEDELREQGKIEYRSGSVDDNNKAMEESIDIGQRLSIPTKLVQQSVAKEVSNEKVISYTFVQKV